MEAKADVRKELKAKWPKISKNEVDDIVGHHDHLRSALVKHYKLSEKEAKKQEHSFFAEFEPKKAAGGGCG